MCFKAFNTKQWLNKCSSPDHCTFSIQSHNSTPQAGVSVGLEAEVRAKLESWRVLSFLWAAFCFWRTEARVLEGNTLRLCFSSKWQMGKAEREREGRGAAIKSVRRPPLPLPHHSSPPHSAVQSSPVQISEQASNPWGWVSMTTVRCCSYHGCHCCRWWSDASSSSCWLSTSPEGYRGGLAGSGFTQCHGVADSGPNSGTNDALGHSGTGVGVEEVLVLVVVVVVVVVRSRYH